MASTEARALGMMKTGFEVDKLETTRFKVEVAEVSQLQ